MSDELTRAFAMRLASLERRTYRMEAQEYSGGTTAGSAGTAVFNDASGNPADVGTAPLDGISEYAARLDHVHELPRALLFSDASGNPIAVGTASASDGTSVYAARLDHVHTLDFARALMFNDAEGNPANVGTAPSDGASTYAARRDHVHEQTSGLGTAAFNDGLGNPANVGTAPSDGTSVFASRSDHAHSLTDNVYLNTINILDTLNVQAEGGNAVLRAPFNFGGGSAPALEVRAGYPSPDIVAAFGTAGGFAMQAGTIQALGAGGIVLRGSSGTASAAALLVNNGTVAVTGPATMSSTMAVTGLAGFGTAPTTGLAIHAPGTVRVGRLELDSATRYLDVQASGALVQRCTSTTLNNGDILDLGLQNSVLRVIDATESYVGEFFLRGAANAVQEISDPSNVFTTTKDTGSSFNVYFETSSYYLQNNRGANRAIALFVMQG